jgi:hypothetical protein
LISLDPLRQDPQRFASPITPQLVSESYFEGFEVALLLEAGSGHVVEASGAVQSPNGPPFESLVVLPSS